MDPYLAQVIIFAGNFAPRGWALCNGQLVSIAEQTALFALVGTTYGGDGQVTFAYPDLRGRVPVGTQNNGSNIGEVGGSESKTLISSQIPPHTHPATATAAITQREEQKIQLVHF
jgi:microcystin-dependent protein